MQAIIFQINVSITNQSYHVNSCIYQISQYSNKSIHYSNFLLGPKTIEKFIKCFKFNDFFIIYESTCHNEIDT